MIVWWRSLILVFSTHMAECWGKTRMTERKIPSTSVSPSRCIQNRNRGISGDSGVNDKAVLVFHINDDNVRPSNFNIMVILHVDIPQDLNSFILHYTLRCMPIPLFSPLFPHTVSSGPTLQHCHAFISIPSELTSTYTQSQCDWHSHPSHHTIYTWGDSAILSVWCLTLLVLRACPWGAHNRASVYNNFRSAFLNHSHLPTTSVVSGHVSQILAVHIFPLPIP